MVQLQSKHYKRTLMKRRKIIGGGLWDSVFGALKTFAQSEPAKNLIRSGVSSAAQSAPGLLGRAWNWIKSKFTGKKSEDKVPELVNRLSKVAGDQLSNKVLSYIDTKTGTPASSSGEGMNPLGGSIKRKGKGVSPLGSGLSSEKQKLIQSLTKMGSGIKFSH